MNLKYQTLNDFLLAASDIFKGTNQLDGVNLRILDPTKRYVFLRGRSTNPIGLAVSTMFTFVRGENLDWLSQFMEITEKYHEKSNDFRLRKFRSDVLYKAEGTLFPISYVNPGRGHPTLRYWEADGGIHLDIIAPRIEALYELESIFYTWAILQEHIAQWLGLKVGICSIHTPSLYIEESGKDKLKLIALNSNSNSLDRLYKLPRLHLSSYYYQTEELPEPNQLWYYMNRNITWEAYAVLCMFTGQALHKFKMTGTLIGVFNVGDTAKGILGLPPSVERVVLVEYLLRIGFFMDLSGLNLTEDEVAIITDFNKAKITHDTPR